MSETTAITVRAADTDPLELKIGAANLSDLSDLQQARIYIRKRGESGNHVDGAALSVLSSEDRELQFDPEGAASDGADALTEAGIYAAHVWAEWSDGRVTRHPADSWLQITVTQRFDS